MQMEVSFNADTGILTEARPVGSAWHPDIKFVIIDDLPETMNVSHLSIGIGFPFSKTLTDYRGVRHCNSRYIVPANLRVHNTHITMSQLEDSQEWLTLLTEQ
jgi:hypothetical protein